ncbi:MAG TPA: hypothetical protein VEF36_05495 [Roseiarcus sp.]|nr:hypothetical protein [Roseiarcus sp.]
MKTVMRQSLDGVTEIIDQASAGAFAGRAAPKLSARVNWTGALVWYMRTLAWVWVVKGLFNWSLVLGAFPSYGDFTMLPRSLQGSVVFFAAVDLLAAVGLWLAAPWGGVVWLLCAAIEAVSPALGVRGAVTGALGVALNIVLVALYFLLSWRAGQERI